ncbi:MAG TPA: glycosyltransferase family 2 protein [Puia sp.]|jgi:glycosyltransferase involved in cell wall biosynthesis|nr:glycosyltransferase family 2 protein [Puia sp.]
MDISVIVPLLNEEESLPELAAWIARVMNNHQFSYEVIMVDDGSTDRSWEVIESLHEQNNRFKGIRFQRNYGKSAALNEGFKTCQGNVVITMDADLQDDPEEIPALYQMISRGGFDLVSGWKKLRHDPISKTLPSKFFNWVTSKVSKIKLHDFNCGLKAYRYNVVKSIEVYGEMHRYIPLIAKWAGFKKIGEKVVDHHARKYGISKFGVGRLITGGLDLASIMFVGKYGKRPMHFFGSWGMLWFMVGFIVLFYLTISKFFFDKTGITQRPLFFVALVAMVIGTQLFVTGFVAELISRNSPNRNVYLIEKRTDL